jgi:hypothetical protein
MVLAVVLQITYGAPPVSLAQSPPIYADRHAARARLDSPTISKANRDGEFYRHLVASAAVWSMQRVSWRPLGQM